MKSQRSGLFALVCLGLLACGSAWGQEKKEMTPLDIPMIGDIEMLKAGDPAPKFSLEDVEGKTFRLEGSDKVYLLVFWSIFCEPCKAEMPLIQRLYDEYKGQGLEVVSVAMDGEPMKKSIQGLVKQAGYTFTVLVDKLAADESFVAADPYGVAGTPTIYIVGRDLKVRFAEVGQTSKEVLTDAIQKALAAE